MENEKTSVMLLKTADGREVNLTESLALHPAFIIGTDARAGLRLMGADIESSHAVVTRRDAQYFVAPRVPSAKVLLNGRPVTMPTRLNVGDKLQLGAVFLTVVQSEAVYSSPTVSPLLPAVTKGQSFVSVSHSPAIGTASAAAIRPIDQPPQIYFPKSERRQGVNLPVLITGAILLVIIVVIGYSLVTGSLTSAADITSQFAYKDGHVTVALLETSWCQLCKQQEPVLTSVASEYRGKVFNQFLDAEAFANSTIIEALKVDSYPSTIIFNDQGQVVAKLLGLTDAATVRAAINQALSQSVG